MQRALFDKEIVILLTSCIWSALINVKIMGHHDPQTSFQNL